MSWSGNITHIYIYIYIYSINREIHSKCGWSFILWVRFWSNTLDMIATRVHIVFCPMHWSTRPKPNHHPFTYHHYESYQRSHSITPTSSLKTPTFSSKNPFTIIHRHLSTNTAFKSFQHPILASKHFSTFNHSNKTIPWRP